MTTSKAAEAVLEQREPRQRRTTVKEYKPMAKTNEAQGAGSDMAAQALNDQDASDPGKADAPAAKPKTTKGSSPTKQKAPEAHVTKPQAFASVATAKVTGGKAADTAVKPNEAKPLADSSRTQKEGTAQSSSQSKTAPSAAADKAAQPAPKENLPPGLDVPKKALQASAKPPASVPKDVPARARGFSRENTPNRTRADTNGYSGRENGYRSYNQYYHNGYGNGYHNGYDGNYYYGNGYQNGHGGHSNGYQNGHGSHSQGASYSAVAKGSKEQGPPPGYPQAQYTADTKGSAWRDKAVFGEAKQKLQVHLDHMVASGTSVADHASDIMTYIEDIRQQSAQLDAHVQKDEAYKQSVEAHIWEMEQQIEDMKKRVQQQKESLVTIDQNIAKKKASKTEYDRIVKDVEAGYQQILATSQAFVSVLQQQTEAIRNARLHADEILEQKPAQTANGAAVHLAQPTAEVAIAAGSS